MRDPKEDGSQKEESHASAEQKKEAGIAKEIVARSWSRNSRCGCTWNQERIGVTKAAIREAREGMGGRTRHRQNQRHSNKEGGS